jgi:hypothetical protein
LSAVSSVFPAFISFLEEIPVFSRLSLILVLSVIMSTAALAEGEHLGDINSDGIVNALDLLHLSRIWQTEGILSASCPWSASGEAVYLLQSSVGIGTASPLAPLDVRGWGLFTTGIETFSATGAPYVVISHTTNESEIDHAGAMATYGTNGEHNFIATTLAENPDLGFAAVANASGDDRAYMTIDDESKAGWMATIGPNETYNTIICSEDGKPNQGAVIVCDDQGRERASMISFLSSGEGLIRAYGPNGHLNAVLTSQTDEPDLGFISVTDEVSISRVLMTINPAGDGYLESYGPNGKLNAQISSGENQPNRGYLGIYDENGAAKAGMYIDEGRNGVLFYNSMVQIKSHPLKPGYDIQYGSLSGPEEGVYCRGKVTLQEGRATIALPEHFVAMAQPGSLTVQLTPINLDTVGVGVASITDNEITIGELQGGTSGFEVHYTVNAAKAGQEGFEAVVKKIRLSEPQKSGGMNPKAKVKSIIPTQQKARSEALAH